MRNLKKSLALVLVFAMVLSFAANAAFTDVPVDGDYAVEIGALANLGILKGYEDGSFAPNGTLTRAEAATVIYRMITGQVEQKMLSATTPFTDLPYDHWASGYVAFCVELGIINGYPDGSFKPSQPVSYQEFIKMLVTALGYVSTEANPISYPNGYIAIATVQQVTKGVNAAGTEPATRAMVAKLSYNGIMDATYKRVEATDTNKKPTIAKDVLGILSVEGTLTQIDEDKNISIVANDNTADLTKIPVVDGKKWEQADEAYVGMNVSVMYKKDDVSGKVTLFGVTPVGNTILTVAAKDFVTANNYLKYKVSGVEKDLKLRAQVAAVPGPGFVEGIEVYRNDYRIGSALDPAAAINPLVDKNAARTFTFISTKGGTTYDVVKVTDTKFAKVDTVTDKKVVVKFNDLTYVTLTTIDSDSKATDVVYYSGIAKDDRVAVTLGKDYQNGAKSTVENGKIVKIEKATGTLSSVTGGTDFAFDGTTYKLATGSNNIDGNLSDSNVGKDFDYYVIPGTNFIGEVEMTSDANSGQYMYIISSQMDSFVTRVKAVNENGDEKTYNFASNKNVFSVSGATKNAVSANIGGKDVITHDGSTDIKDQIFRYSLNDAGEITKLTAVTAVSPAGGAGNYDPSSTNGYNKDTKAFRYNSAVAGYVTETSVVFVVNTATQKYEVTKGAVNSITGGSKHDVTGVDIKAATSSATAKIRAALIKTNGTARAAESANKDVVGFLASGISVQSEGSKYVAYATVAYAGNAPTVLYSAAKDTSDAAVNEFTNGNALIKKGSMVQFDIDSSGKLTNGRAPDTNYAATYTEKVEGNLVLTKVGPTSATYLLNSDSKVYRFDKDNNIVLADSGAIMSSIYDGFFTKAQIAYISYKVDSGNNVIKSIFVKDERTQFLSAIPATATITVGSDGDAATVDSVFNGVAFPTASFVNTASGNFTVALSNMSGYTASIGTVAVAYGTTTNLTVSIIETATSQEVGKVTVPVAVPALSTISATSGVTITITDSASDTATFTWNGTAWSVAAYSNTDLAAGAITAATAAGAGAWTGTTAGAVTVSPATVATGTVAITVTIPGDAGYANMTVPLTVVVG